MGDSDGAGVGSRVGGSVGFPVTGKLDTSLAVKGVLEGKGVGEILGEPVPVSCAGSSTGPDVICVGLATGPAVGLAVGSTVPALCGQRTIENRLAKGRLFLGPKCCRLTIRR